jgi:hypothetical protein
MNDRKLLKIILALGWFVVACSSEKDTKIDTSQVKLDVSEVTVQRLDAEMIQLKTKPAIQAFLDKNRNLKEAYLQPEPGMPDSAVVNRIYQTVTNPDFQKFYGQVQQTFGNMKEVQAQLEQAFKHIKYYYPDFKAPKVQAVVSGLGSFSRDAAALSVSDSLIVIGLDFYAGEKAMYVPSVPNFLLKKYTKAALVPSIVGVLAEKFIAQNQEDKSLLNDMVVAGKKLEFTHQMMPETPDSLIIFYSPKQLQDTETHKDVVWAHFVKEKLLYETNHFKKIKYTGDRPYTAEIGQDCPGAIGRWLGWQIVRKYMIENPDVTLPQLMRNADAQDIFMKSKYKGE